MFKYFSPKILKSPIQFKVTPRDLLCTHVTPNMRLFSHTVSPLLFETFKKKTAV